MFPLMEGDAFGELIADIQANGLRETITLYQGKVLDGRNRYRACREAGIEVKTEPFEGTEADARAFVISKNIHRRHLTTEQKRDLIAKLVKAQPERSDRAIGEMAKVSKNTVKSVRGDLEARGQIDHVKTRTDSKGRKQPAKKRAKKVKAKTTTAAAEEVQAPYDPVAWASERTPEEVTASLEALSRKRIGEAWPKAWRPDPSPAHRDGIRGSDLEVTLTKLMRQALTSLETARPDKEADAITALRKISAKLKAGGHSICDFQVAIKGVCPTKRAA
jgi:ParB-like chromosome segregation protein Spo0J